MKHVNLYSTSHCHLCETALSITMKVLDQAQFKVIEISEDEILLARYSLKIPVLQRQDTLAELAWPFDEASIRSFLK